MPLRICKENLITVYLHRHIEDKLKKMSRNFKIVLVEGARQVGKSTLLSALFPEAKVFVFDPVQDLYGARRDPDLFLNQFSPPLILDEIQFVPELLPALKRKVDQSENKGQYLLTGSQNLSVLKSVAESLAGRVGILQLDIMTPYELTKNLKTNWLKDFLVNPTQLMNLQNNLPISLYEHLWQGGYPGLLTMDADLFSNYFSSYINTYVERDIRVLGNIQDVREFGRFMSLISALTAQEINYSQLGREIELAPNTAKRWCNLLEQTYQLFEIWPYEGNTIKRISKKSRIYMRDTGICCYLQKISSSAALAGYPKLGALFETLCIHIIRQFAKLLNTVPQFYHWRTSGGAEVDLILEFDGLLYPIEFKCKTNIRSHDFSGIKAFFETYPTQTKHGAIIYAGEHIQQGMKNVWLIPWNIST